MDILLRLRMFHATNLKTEISELSSSSRVTSYHHEAPTNNTHWPGDVPAPPRTRARARDPLWDVRGAHISPSLCPLALRHEEQVEITAEVIRLRGPLPATLKQA